jgi:hypothetical protein
MTTIRFSLIMIGSIIAAPAALGEISTNVPLDHYSYRSIDKLIGMGLIDSALSGTKPFTRIEMARLTAQAIKNVQARGENNTIVLAMVERLKNDFSDELATLGEKELSPPDNYVKPIEDPYVRLVEASKPYNIENQHGEKLDKDTNLRAGLASRGKFANSIAYYVNPEYGRSSSEGQDNVDIVSGYAKVELGAAEVEVGKDSMWWGPGWHGGLIMTNNAEALTMVKVSNAQPVELPWILGYLGPFKAVWFLSQLEENREIPEPMLTGVRLNFKPVRDLEVGLSRTILFGGKTRPSLGLLDYFKIFFGSQNQSGKLESDQLAGFDIAYYIHFDDMPVRSVKLYTEMIGEDEAGYLPSKWGRLYGVQFNDILKKGTTDLRLEYADDYINGQPNVFYQHALYTDGYTYRGRVLGHHMGTDARDYYARIDHYLSKDIVLGLDFDLMVSKLAESRHQNIEQYGLDATFFATDDIRYRLGYRFEHARDINAAGNSLNNHIIFAEAVYSF